MAASILLIDDDGDVLSFYQDVLTPLGHRLELAPTAEDALDLVGGKRYDVIVSDIRMPGMDGLQLLKAVRAVDLDVPVILVTGTPTLDTALRAMELGAYRYLTKPVNAGELRRVVSYAVTLSRMATAKREALKIVAGLEGYGSDRAGMEEVFNRALSFCWMAYQPIVSWSQRTVIGYEALARTADPAFASPLLLIETAEKLGRVAELGHRFRQLVAETIHLIPQESAVFVNVHPRDLTEGDLLSPDAPLAKNAHRIVVEITERASLEAIPGAHERATALRSMGYRIAIDDLGAGHAGLSTFARLEPDVAKIDMGLIRGIDTDRTKQKIVRSMTELCRDMNVRVVSEGVETMAERDTLLSVGCAWQQGFLFGRPERAIHAATWS